MVGIARQTHMQVVHYLRKRVNYNDSGILTGVIMGTLPAGAMILNLNVRMVTAANGTGAAVNVGTTAGGTQLFTDAGTAGARSPTIPSLSFVGDTDIYVTLPGTGATTGQGDIVISYAVNNDL